MILDNAMRFFYIRPDAINQSKAVIQGPDASHIRNVLRYQAGDEIGLTDGTGNTYRAVIDSFPAEGIAVAILELCESKKDPGIRVTMAQALLKNKKMDILIRQLTELGIYRWIPLTTERSIARLDPKRFAERRKRWEKIAISALKQCQRGRLPHIGEATAFDEFVGADHEYDIKIMFWEREVETLEAICREQDRHRCQNILLVLGPEGGFSNREVEKANAKGFQTVSLGPRVLRADTASIAACTLIQFLFGDMGNSNK